MNLREYQKTVIDRLRQSLRAGSRRPLLVSPTGSGKTVVMSEIIRCAADKGSDVVVMVPRRELAFQMSEKLDLFGVKHGIIMAGESMRPYERVQVCSWDTLHARAMRRQKIQLPKAALILIDEAHTALTDTRKDILDAYPDARIIGVTATPCHGSGKGLGDVYDDLVQSCTVRELTDAGYLVPVRYFAPSEPDLKGLRLKKDGDYQESGLAARMDPLVGDVVQNWMRIASDRRTVVFCVNRDHARHVAAEFERHGVQTAYLDGETPTDDRRDILHRIEHADLRVVVSIGVLTMGWDSPSVSCAILARPTHSLGLYLQMAGRILRPSEGKTDCVMIDHSGAVYEHGRVDDPIEWSLDPSSSVSERKAKKQKERKEPKDITCCKCKTVFRGARRCPSCGHELIPQGKPIPTHQADLMEVVREGSTRNRKDTWDQKAEFMAGLRCYAKRKGYSDGWCAHQYRSRYSVWPRHESVKNATPSPTVPHEVLGWIQHQAIKRSKAA